MVRNARMLALAIAALSWVMIGSDRVSAQCSSQPVVIAPVPQVQVSYYVPVPQVSFYQPAVAYYTPAVSYYVAPAPAVSFYAAPSAVTTTTRFGLFGRPRQTTTTIYR
jgi:hypothetical protein